MFSSEDNQRVRRGEGAIFPIYCSSGQIYYLGNKQNTLVALVDLQSINIVLVFNQSVITDLLELFNESIIVYYDVSGKVFVMG